ncbi:MAG: SPOR domain-containing protein [Thiobacillus sp.]
MALTLLAIIVLPLLLEDKPPPASSLAVKMLAAPSDEPARPEPVPAASAPTPPPVGQALPAPRPEPETAALAPVPHKAVPPPAEHKPVPRPEVKPEAKTEAKPAPLPPAVQPALKPAERTAPPGPAQGTFVVQLAALSDAAKARALAARASQTGLPAYTDAAGKLTRVRVGPFPSREAAVAAAVKLAENGLAGQVIAK